MPKKLSLIIALIGLCLFGQGAYIGVKATAAQVLMERAWAEIESGEAAVATPWPWLDANVVGKLSVPHLNQSAIVLDTDSGQALAFGPTLIAGAARPNQRGTIGIAAHKNTHFTFLKDLKNGDTLSFEHAHGVQNYIVRHAEIIDSRHAGLSINDETDTLALVTCYPFDSLSFNGPLRYIVYAEAVDTPNAAITRI